MPPTRADIEEAPVRTGTARATGTRDGRRDATGITRPDPSDAEPVPHAALTRPDDDRPSSATGFIADNLPGPLDDRFAVVRELDPGGEGRIYLCRDRRNGSEIVLKLLDRRREGQAAIWRLWEATDEAHVVPLVAHHVEGERCYEATDYHPGGSLADRARRPEWPLPVPTVREILRQLARALQHIHTELPEMLVHRDVKPGNILVRASDPIDIRLTDFGLAGPQQETFMPHSGARTAAYSPPEAVGSSSPAWDWWSVGMTVVELLQGHHPFENGAIWATDAEISAAINSGPVPVDPGVDDDWGLLFAGLLTRDPRRRWGFDEVRRWLAGERPEVYDHPAASSTPPPEQPLGAPFPFAGAVYHQPADLAGAMASRWPAAAALLQGRQWWDLRSWAAACSTQLAERLDECERLFLLADHRSADRAVAEVLVRLDPAMAPTFHGRPVDLGGLVELAAEAAGGAPDAVSVVDALSRSGALRAFGRLPEQQQLTVVDERWQHWCAVAEAAIVQAFGSTGELSSLPRLRPLLLGAACSPNAAQALATEAGALATRRNRRIRWFGVLVDGTRGDDATAFHAVIVLCAGVVLDPRFRVSRRDRERTRQPGERGRIRSAGPAPVPPRTTLRERLRRAGPALPVLAGVIGLAVVAGVGVGAATGTVQGALTTLVLLTAAACLGYGSSRPGRRSADAALGAFAGGWIGLGLATVAGIVVGFSIGPVVGWPTFWTTWITTIGLATVLGAAE